jgi:hypothetical protein
MKQKVIIGFSVLLLLAAVFMIGRDLFTTSPSLTATPCCGDDVTAVKKIDSTTIGYKRIRLVQTGLKNLSGISVNENKQIFVCGSNQITVFDSAGSKINTFEIDTAASCIAITGNDIYLGMGARVAHYSLSERKLEFWNPGIRRGLITALAVNGNYLYAADAVKKRIVKYTKAGSLALEIGMKDSTTGAPGFILPSPYFDLAFDSFNELWVANTGRLRLENYTTTGHFQSSWGVSSFSNDGFGGCCNPAQITILPDGDFVTYEKGIDKIKVFDPTGRFLCIVAGAGSFRGSVDFQLGNLHLVKDIASSFDGTVYVLDAYNQINIFRKKNL